MANIKLGLDLNCFTNRFPEPKEWTRIVQELGIKHVQFNADLLDPFLPWDIQEKIIAETVRLCRERGITIHSSFGGHSHHQNYLGHPNSEVARWCEGFYKRLIRQVALLGGEGTGTCFAIMSSKDASDPQRKKEVLQRAALAYISLSCFAKEEGLKYLLFETTSVPRETCATFAETDFVLDLLKDMEIPMKICLDVGHRNMENPYASEANPYAWIRRYGKIAPVIHIQQSNSSASCHWPFTPEYNEKGDIIPEKVIEAIEQSGAEDCLLAMEINHKAYYPNEVKVIENIKKSVDYWRRWVVK